ncbi:MAG TPA: metallophosphoesterase [Actinomycetota bacterium]|jgi:Icc-related predicted phosphoesterase|nr:metallophosphoesterase [Actinomycetota bacterium]
MLKVFYATDLHGSEVCWRKLVNAGPFYGADVVICGGDMTGKAMIPIVDEGSRWRVTFQDLPYALDSEEQVREIEKKIINRGYYPVRVSRDEMAALVADQNLVDERFKEAMLTTVGRWMDIAQEKLAGTDIRLIVCPGNDDMFEVDKVIARSDVVEMGEGKVLDLGGFSMVSMGWTNPTPWNTYREAPEDKLRVRIERMVDKTPDLRRTIFNFHAPPFGSNLDDAPALDEDLQPILGGRAMRPVGSRAVRESIAEHQPLVSLHGHIHEGKGTQRLGKTLAINPGSAYEEGVLQGSIVELDDKRGKVKNYQLVTG